MFKGKIYVLILIFLTAAAYTAWFFHAPTSRDYHFYQRLMTVSDGDRQPVQNQALAQQERIHVNKQFIFNQGNQRLQWRLESETSNVSLNQIGHSIEFVEKLHEMVCTMQEKIVQGISEDNPSSFQLIRRIEAKDATYRYKYKQLWADHVKLTRYRIPDNYWIQNFSPYKPFMEGNAQSIQLTFAKEPLFKAQGFQAVLQEWE